MPRKKAYPAWKKVLWRFVRVFVGVFIVTVGTNLTSLENPLEWYQALLVPAFSAGLVALGKAVREWVASGDYTRLVHRLPL